MARCPGPAGMLDVRSSAIFQDVIWVSVPNCNAGANRAKTLIDEFYSNGYTETRNPVDPGLIPGPDDKRFDQTSDWVSVLGAATIACTILGTIHSYAAIMPFLGPVYGIGQVEAIVIGTVTYFLIIALGPLSCCLMNFMGSRLTCQFGMFLFFLGIFLDTFCIHKSMFYIDHLLFMGFGGAFAYTPAMSSPVDHFRTNLPTALMIMSLSSPVGTALFYPFSVFILGLFNAGDISLRWHSLSMAIIVLVLTSLTFVFKHRLPKHINPFRSKIKTDKQKVDDCVEQSKKPQLDECGVPIPGTGEDEKRRERNSCLCVCVCDVSVITDASFLLWAILCLFAMLSLYIPYLFLAKYQNEVVSPPRERGNPLTLILLFCAASAAGRAVTVFDRDWTFGYNRVMFVGVMIGQGIIYLFAAQAVTFGWIIVLTLALGALEGVLSTVIPRVTLQTLPRRWMESAWPYVVVFLGLGLMIGSIMLISAWYGTGGFYGIGFVVIGICQLIAGILAFILPNEEESTALQPPVTPAAPPPIVRPESYYFGPNPYSKRLAELSSSGGGMSFGSYAFSSGGMGFGISPFAMAHTPGSPGFAAAASVEAKAYLARCTGGSNVACVSLDPCACEYGLNCPICSKIGAIPGCCGCLPSLAAKGTMIPSSSSGGYSTGMNMASGSGGPGGAFGGPSSGGFSGPGGAFAGPSSGGFSGPSSGSLVNGPNSGNSRPLPHGESKQGSPEGTVIRTNYEIRHKITTKTPTGGSQN